MTGFAAFGNDELAAAPEVGDTAKCPDGHDHPVETLGGILQAIDCGEKKYLVGIRGKSTTGIGSTGKVDLDD